MSALYLVTLALSYLLGVLTTVEAYRYRRRRLMPEHKDEKPSRILAFIRRHAAAFVIVSVLLDVILTGALAFVSVEVKHLQECQGGYLNGSVRVAQARDDAMQKLVDDIAQHVGEDTFLRDVTAEQEAAAALTKYRTNQVPKEACP